MINVNVSNENNIETFKTLLILKITLWGTKHFLE